jgi:hypothetical protein
MIPDRWRTASLRVITLWPVVTGVQNFGPDAVSHTGAMENLRREH